MSDQAPVSRPAAPSSRGLWAYGGPFALFIVLQAVTGMAKSTSPAAPWWLRTPEFWVYPLQTAACAAMLLFYRREYPRATSPLAALFGAAIGALVFALWISPQAFFHFAPRARKTASIRRACSPPGQAWNDSWPYRFTVAWRFLRLALVVPWLEEIFWRGFLLRFLIKEDFLSLPFGSWTPLSFGVVVLGFTFEHSRPDWPAACVTGVLYNLVAVRAKSLPACVLAHALTNALLGGYVMATHQWGFW